MEKDDKLQSDNSTEPDWDAVAKDVDNLDIGSIEDKIDCNNCYNFDIITDCMDIIYYCQSVIKKVRDITSLVASLPSADVLDYGSFILTIAQEFCDCKEHLKKSRLIHYRYLINDSSVIAVAICNVASKTVTEYYRAVVAIENIRR